ncbi:Copia protein, partial [Mucuna pruriens]
MARTLLNDFNSPKYFWVEAINTTFYLQNKIYIRSILKRTPNELWKGRQPNISYFHPFGCECFILNTKDNLEKYDLKSNKGTFLGYSITSKAYRLNDSLAQSNLGDLKTPSKEHDLDNEPKVDEAKTSSRNW